jgi:Mg2+-importing ATPase
MINLKNFLNISEDDALSKINSSRNGLSSREVEDRLKEYGTSNIKSSKTNIPRLLWRQIGGNPLVIILSVATAISYIMGQHTSAYYIFAMIILSAGLGFWNEYSAERTVKELLDKVSLLSIVIRDDKKKEIPAKDVTVGDIVLLSPGTILPADIRLIQSDSLEIDQSALTGESKTAFKVSHAVDDNVRGFNDYSNIAFMGTSVTSGSGIGVVVQIGKDTEFGKIAHDSSFIRPETDFQKGLRLFGNLIIKVIIILTLSIFLVNSLLGHKFMESLLFALSIAIGLTPELLPVIVTISLSHGAGKLAKHHVVCKQLIAIENIGNMDIFCTDKTGTLTEGNMTVTKTINATGKDTPELINLGILCNGAVIQHKIIGNAIDIAIWEEAHKRGLSIDKKYKKIYEKAFDYEKRAMFSVIDDGTDGSLELIVKGSPDAVLEKCNKCEVLSEANKMAIDLYNDGLRAVAIATKRISSKEEYDWSDISDLEFKGFIAFLDIPKKTVKPSIEKLEKLGVSLKIITGDNELVTKHICNEVGLSISNLITGVDLEKLSQEEQEKQIEKSNVFARVTPSQKLQIIATLRKNGHIVGYMGDGINDIPALHSSDVSVSVNTAVDVAKDAASIVLLRKGLDVIAEGVVEGRRTFANTIKYIIMGTSSNFGNMFSAAISSFILPFLPMLPSQILLNNCLYDISQASIPTDNVDDEALRKPQKWNLKFIKLYMMFFGPISSLFDFITFGIMIYIFHASPSMFQTGWFVESLATQVLVVFIIRTNRQPFYKSKPSKWLTLTCLAVVGIGVLLPFSPLAASLGFVALPPLYFICLIALVLVYLGLVAVLRKKFLEKVTM